jgi:hypothetical protein
MATSAAVAAWQRAYNGYGTTQAEITTYAPQYQYLWHWYKSSVYEDLAQWSQYKGTNRLYRYTRNLYNPVNRLVEFYVSAIYPGRLAMDSSTAPGGQRLAVPFAPDTPDDLRAAIGQFWQWSNWQANMALMVRFGAAMGDALVEIDDAAERGKVLAVVHRPWLLSDLDCDAQGNVQGYALQYEARDLEGETYLYRKEVTRETIRTLKNGDAYDYENDVAGGELAETDNPYGFVPAVWIKHRDEGDDYGAPAIHNLSKLDELNSTASHLHDRLHVKLAAPILVAGDGDIGRLFDTPKQDNSSVVERARAKAAKGAADGESLNLLHGPTGATVNTVNMELDDALPYMADLMAEIERDHPELSMWATLRGMSSVTGPAAERLMGDVGGLVAQAQAQYDQQSIKLFQMAVAIGGWRANSGAWGPALTAQQALFKPFDLDSYAGGQLDFTILPRPLIPAMRGENLASQAAAIAALTNAGADLYSAAKVAGLSEEESQLLFVGDRPNGVSQ